MTSGEIHRCGDLNSWNYGMKPQISKPPTNEEIFKIRNFLDDFFLDTQCTKDLKIQTRLHDMWKQSKPINEKCYGTHRKDADDPLIIKIQRTAFKKIFNEQSISKLDDILEIGSGPPFKNGSWFSRAMPDYDIKLSDCKPFDTGFVIDLDDTDSFKKLPTKMKAVVAFNVFTCQTLSILERWLENIKFLLVKDGLVFVFSDTVPFYSSAVALVLKQKQDSFVLPYMNLSH